MSISLEPDTITTVPVEALPKMPTSWLVRTVIVPGLADPKMSTLFELVTVALSVGPGVADPKISTSTELVTSTITGPIAAVPNATASMTAR